jgi:hypothetical protein
MKQVDSDSGPFRSVEVPKHPSAPPPFVFRHDENELVVEGRRRFETEPRIMLAILAIFLGANIALKPSGSWLVYAGIMTCAGAAWTIAKFWARTTLILRDPECSVVYRGLFRSRRLRGPLRTLDIVGITEINPRPGGYENRWPIYGLQLSLGGSQALVFRAVPRQDLEWVIGQVLEWRGKHGPVEPAVADGPDPRLRSGSGR